jgi:cobyrinic acid a,c-diamide synthase
MQAKALIIAGVRSGCGKTLSTLGIMAACKARGLKVQGFKCGPDFIDPGRHAEITGRPSHNLDSRMMPRKAVGELFSRHAAKADICIIEGVMGLYDGARGGSEEGSTAEIAKLLSIPVLLVADVASMARSAAAEVLGYTSFDPDLNFAGVLLNKAGSSNHIDLLQEAFASRPARAPLLGILPRDERMELPSRHLGLVTTDDHALGSDRIAALAEYIEAHVDLDALIAGLPDVPLPDIPDAEPAARKTRIAVPRDEAFCFYYEENLRLLHAAGAELVFFSPLRDQGLPEEISGLYIGGGYPELHAQALSANTGMRADILAFSRSGRPVYAECGGFMYLCSSIIDADEKPHAMVGVFDADVRMEKRFQALGYREISLLGEAPLGEAGDVLRGHEFHYSRLLDPPRNAQAIYAVHARKGKLESPEGFLVGKTLGSYVHLHFASRPKALDCFVEACTASGPWTGLDV